MANVCDNYCKGCIYMGLLQSYAKCCNYYEKTGKRRPCPAGTGCTVKVDGKKRRAWDCPEDAKERHRRQARERARRIREAEKKNRLHTVTCRVCGKVFETADSRRKLCSHECYEEAQRIRLREIYRRKANEKAQSTQRHSLCATAENGA